MKCVWVSDSTFDLTTLQAPHIYFVFQFFGRIQTLNCVVKLLYRLTVQLFLTCLSDWSILDQHYQFIQKYLKLIIFEDISRRVFISHNSLYSSATCWCITLTALLYIVNSLYWILAWFIRAGYVQNLFV